MKILRRDHEQRANFVTTIEPCIVKELQQIIKMGLVQGNLIPAFAGAWLAVVMSNHSFLSSILNSINVDWININYGWRLCIK